jgi:hypothetical protein
MKVVPIENYKSWAERLFVEINEYVDLMSY